MPYAPLQGQVKVRNFAKMTDFKVYRLRWYAMHVIKRLTVNYDTSRHCPNFDCTDFFIFIVVRYHVTFKLRVSHHWQTNFASYEESIESDSPGWGLFVY